MTNFQDDLSHMDETVSDVDQSQITPETTNEHLARQLRRFQGYALKGKTPIAHHSGQSGVQALQTMLGVRVKQ